MKPLALKTKPFSIMAALPGHAVGPVAERRPDDFVLVVGTGLYSTIHAQPRMATVATFPIALIPLFGVGISGAADILALRLLSRRGRGVSSGRSSDFWAWNNPRFLGSTTQRMDFEVARSPAWTAGWSPS